MNTQIEATVLHNSKPDNEIPLQRDDKRRLNTPEIESDKYIRVEDSSLYEPDKSRKKPGRKPSTAEPANKRLAQNRAAQRAFRERKDTYVKELELKVQELENARRLAEEENKKLQLRLSKFQNTKKEETEFITSRDLPSKTSECSEDRTVIDSGSDAPKVFEVNSGDTNLENWSSPQKNSLSTPQTNSLPTPQTNDINFNFAGNTLPQNNSFPLYTEDNSIISPTSAFSLNDYMAPYGSLTNDPLIDFNSGINFSSNQDMMTFNSYNNNVNLGFNPALFDYSSLANNVYPTDFSAFDPVLYADFIQSFDPYNVATLPTPTPSHDSLKEVSTQPSSSKESSTANDCPEKLGNVDINLLNQAKKAAEEFDLDSLCSMLKDKATCSEIKQFFKTHCKDPVV